MQRHFPWVLLLIIALVAAAPVVAQVAPTLPGGGSTPGVLVNGSAFGHVSAGQPVVLGFSLSGSTSKMVLLRGIGPSLSSALGVAGALATPSLQLFDGQGNLMLTNNGWVGGIGLQAVFAQVGAFSLAANSGDAAVVTSLQPGAYTAVVSGSGGATGAALAEFYDLTADPASAPILLTNLSERGQVGAYPDALVQGFVITGQTWKTVLVRGVGPGLKALGVSNPLGSPVVNLFDGKGKLIAENFAWGMPISLSGEPRPALASDIAAACNLVGAFPLSPYVFYMFATNGNDAAILISLAPGAYTAELSGETGSVPGTALLEVYAMP